MLTDVGVITLSPFIFIQNGKKQFKRILSGLCGGRRNVQVTEIAFEVDLCFLHGKKIVLF